MDKKEKYRQIINQYGILFAIVLVGIVFTLSNKNFLTIDNVINTFRQIVVTAAVAIGMISIMTTGDIGVGMGGVTCLTGIVTSLLMSRGISISFVPPAGPLVGAALEFLNGALMIRFTLPSMVVTLGTMNLANRIASLLTGGTAIYGPSGGFLVIDRGSFLGMPNQVWLLAVFAIVSTVVSNKTPFGHRVYVIGGNAEVAKLSGIHMGKVKISLYIVSGICVSVGGITLSSRAGSGQPTLTITINMNVITVVATGGMSLNGDPGTIWGGTMRALLSTMITNGLNVNGTNSYWQLVVSAIVLIITVVVNRNDQLC